jgi:hemerythrin-like domain-containing protein
VLLPVLTRYESDVSNQEPVVRMLAGHVRIRGLVMQLNAGVVRQNVQLQTVNELMDQLEAHFVLEDREVFPLFEQILPQEALEEMYDQLATFEAGSRVEHWVPSSSVSYASWPGPGDSEGGMY